ncbi:MAG: 2-amino-4-hydroxy-6-hydroxymethyldihydropteridine diphosphokinase, partial [Bifidobacteriaceae bacterium]|nr:2-amino-4-hydroxy-6-hydroxymethyldihydropteridine diphosphokinase [Bifidobacteriaceae bacterium]
MDWELGSIGGSLDVIELVGITARGRHGHLPTERENSQPFVVDLALHLDTREAAETDSLNHTVDYRQVARTIVELVEGEPVALLETLAARIADAVLALGRARSVEVAVHKPEAPLGVEFKDVAVRVRRLARESATTFVEPDSAMFEAVREAQRRAELEGDLDAAPVAPAAAPAAAPSVAPKSRALELHDADYTAREGTRAAARRRRQAQAAADQTADWAPDEPVDAIISLGANLGEALNTLRAALEDMREEPGIEVVQVSPLSRTAPVGRPDQPDFFNAVAHIRTTLSPRTLLHTLQGIEEKHGRERTGRWAPRTLDLDLIAYDTLLVEEDELTIPHPRAHERAFVLVPWSLMAPNAFLPGLGGGPVAALAEAAPDKGCIRWLAPDWDRPTRPRGGDAHVGDGAEGDAPRSGRRVADGAAGTQGRAAAGGRSGVSGSGVSGSGVTESGAAEAAGADSRRRVTPAPAAPAPFGAAVPLAEAASPGEQPSGPYQPGSERDQVDGAPRSEPLSPTAGAFGRAAATGQYMPVSADDPGRAAGVGGVDSATDGGSRWSGALSPVAQPLWGGPERFAPGVTPPPSAGSNDEQRRWDRSRPVSGSPDDGRLPDESGLPDEDSLPAPLPAPRPANPFTTKIPGVPSFFAAARQANRAGSGVVVESAAGAGRSGEAAGGAGMSSAFASLAAFESYAASNPAPSLFGQLELAHVPASAGPSSRNEVDLSQGGADPFEPVMVPRDGSSMPARSPHPLPAPADPVAPPVLAHTQGGDGGGLAVSGSPASPAGAPAAPAPVGVILPDVAPGGVPGAADMIVPGAGPTAGDPSAAAPGFAPGAVSPAWGGIVPGAASGGVASGGVASGAVAGAASAPWGGVAPGVGPAASGGVAPGVVPAASGGVASGAVAGAASAPWA